MSVTLSLVFYFTAFLILYPSFNLSCYYLIWPFKLPIIMASITTAVPVAPIAEYCIKKYEFVSPTKHTHCGKAKDGSLDDNYQTICCDGTIINAKRDLFGGGPINVKDLVCCQQRGPQQGGFFPLTNDATECATGTPVPLVSLAATNTKSAQSYTVTYTSAASMGLTDDMIRIKAPTCLWARTAKGAQVTPVTVSAAPEVTPQTTSSNGHFVITNPGSTASGQTTAPSDTSPTGTTKSSAAHVGTKFSLSGLLLLGLALITPLLS
jgi:hypothetical protein